MCVLKICPRCSVSRVAAADLTFKVPPSVWPLVACGSILVFAWWLGGRRTVVVVIRRPAATSLVLVLSVQLMLPSAAIAGGPGIPPSDTAIFRWIISDQVGSGLIEVDKDGFRVQHTVYSPFGTQVQDVGDMGGRKFFGGHERELQTQLVYMNARWYDPASGRFMSVDPALDLRTPQAHNAYSYVANNPVNVTDPTGAIGHVALGAAGGAAVYVIAQGIRGEPMTLGGFTSSVVFGGLVGATLGMATPEISAMQAGVAKSTINATMAISKGLLAMAYQVGVKGDQMPTLKQVLRNMSLDGISAAIPSTGGKLAKGAGEKEQILELIADVEQGTVQELGRDLLEKSFDGGRQQQGNAPTGGQGPSVGAPPSGGGVVDGADIVSRDPGGGSRNGQDSGARPTVPIIDLPNDQPIPDWSPIAPYEEPF